MVIVNMPNIPPLIEGLRKLRLPEECDPRSHTGWDGRPCDPVASNAAAPAEAKHLSIVVLPFTNLSGDPSQDYFADGITENLTTDLSRIRNSFVIARNTAFTFKGKTIDAKEIGKELGVRYILEGSAQRDQNRVRVNAQLIDAETGAHLWADRFEEDVADLFKLQDQVVARLANTLGFELVKAEAQKGARANNPDAGDLVMRGLALLQLQRTKDRVDAARALFDRALAIDPNDADALAGSACAYINHWAGAFGGPEIDYDAKILGQADRAIALAPDSLWAYFAKSVYLYLTHRASDGRRCRRGACDQSKFRPVMGGARQGRGFSRRLRTIEIRYPAGDEVEPARSVDRRVSLVFGRRGTRPRTFRRGSRRRPQVHRLRLPQLHCLRESGSRLCA